MTILYALLSLVSHIHTPLKLFLELKIDAVIATNTTVSRNKIQDHKLSQELGGLSGKPLHSQSNDAIHNFKNSLNDEIPIIGVGGILSKKDAEEKIEAGANFFRSIPA